MSELAKYPGWDGTEGYREEDWAFPVRDPEAVDLGYQRTAYPHRLADGTVSMAYATPIRHAAAVHSGDMGIAGPSTLILPTEGK